MTPLRKKSCPFITSPFSTSRTLASVAVCGERAGQRGAHELGLLARKRVEQPRQDLRGRGCARSRRRPTARRRSFGRRERLRHDVARAGIVEARRAGPARGTGRSRRRGRRRPRAAREPRSRPVRGGSSAPRPCGLRNRRSPSLSIARLQLFGGHGGLALFRARAAAGRGAWRDRRRQTSAARLTTTTPTARIVSQSTTLSASCRYACSLRGNATGYTPV